MSDNKRVILDAGHGGAEPGAVYEGRQEKNDNLNLALAVGNMLADQGIDVVYTRVDDIYQTPYEKAEIGNRSDADYFVSIHRNAMPVPGTASGAQVLIYRRGGKSEPMAENILDNLKAAGLADLGVIERPGLVVLRDTQMPAVLVEAGFIDNEEDNRFFDENFEAIARAVADGIAASLETVPSGQLYYQIQVGAYRDRETAVRQADRLKAQGFPAFLIAQDGYYKVRAGAFLNIDNAARMEQRLREYGYNTYMVRETAVY